MEFVEKTMVIVGKSSNLNKYEKYYSIIFEYRCGRSKKRIYVKV